MTASSEARLHVVPKFSKDSRMRLIVQFASRVRHSKASDMFREQHSALYTEGLKYVDWNGLGML